MSVATDVGQQIASIVDSDRVVLFMKGNRQAPQCGFSAQVVQILDRLLPSYTTFDVLSDMEVREGIKAYSDWPTIPQLYISGEFQGGCDIIREMYDSGELHRALDLETEDPVEPEVVVSDPAKEMLLNARRQYEDQDLHLSIDAHFRHSFGFGPATGKETAVDVDGLVILFDRDSARRAQGLVIDVDAASGGRLRIDNPNQPAASPEAEQKAVQEMSVQSLRELLDEGANLRLLDVRTVEERLIASIEGSELLDPTLTEELRQLPKEAMLVFHCHHGPRAQEAAQQFVAAGFTDVYNLTGGIGAWSREIDPDVPCY